MEATTSTDSTSIDLCQTPSRKKQDMAALYAVSSSKKKQSFHVQGGNAELTPEFDPNAYSAGQSLSSILNNPHSGKSADSSWGAWFSDTSLEAAPPLPSKALPEVSRSDFQSYLGSISEPFSRFVDVREHANSEESELLHPDDNTQAQWKGQGEELVACLREIPSLYFEEDFALETGSTFHAACPFSTIPQNMMLQEKLSHYLDIVEVHLVREISARSDSFFEAQCQLEELNEKIAQACCQIGKLKSTVHLLESDLVDSARNVQKLNISRDNLLALHHKLKLVTYVNQAVSALRLLVAATDCAGALDVIDDLQQLLKGDELVGLHCFRHLNEQLANALDAINSMLAADFVRVAVHDMRDLETSSVMSILNVEEQSAITPEVEVIEEEEASIRELLLPFVIGLLRTSRLPAVLKVYRDTLIMDIKAAIKTVVAELLPVLLTRASDHELPSGDRQTELEIGGLSLATKLRTLSSEKFVCLLEAVSRVVQRRLVRAAEVRHVIEQIIGGLQGSYAAAAVAAAFASGAAAVAAAEAAQEEEQSALYIKSGKLEQSTSLTTITTQGNPSSTISKQFRADVLSENTEAVCAACDAAHGRWAKLLGVRAPIHPRLRLQEFVSIYNITQTFISATEKVGGRLGYSIRGALQSQAKSFVDFQHNARVSKMTAVLDQETWVAVDVPEEFQEIVSKLSHIDSPEEDGVTDGHSAITDKGGDKLENGSINVKPDAQGTVNGHEVSEKQAVSLGETTELKVEALNGPKVDASPKNKKVREKSSIKSLHLHGVSYHMVNSALILLKMLIEYVDVSNALPTLATEVVHRLAEILKVFNSRTCQLVLGAGAMQVSGLKSITAKHLALACQSVNFFYVLIPEIKKVISVYIPEARKLLLLTEIDRVAQDYRLHRDEIYSKLVQIMKERLLVHIRSLQQFTETWNRPEDDMQPSQFAKSLTKEVGVLHRVLSPILQESEIRLIFTRVVALFHSQLADAFSKLDLTTPQSKKRLYRDVHHILSSLRGLPTEITDAEDSGQRTGQLDEFLVQMEGIEE